MKKKFIVLIAIISMLVTACGQFGDPMPEDMYTRGVYPGYDSIYSVGGNGTEYAEGWFDNLYVGGIAVAGGAGANAFGTIDVVAGGDPVADSATDTLTLTSSTSTITLTGNAGTDTIDLTLPATVTMDVDWDTIGEIETATGVNVLISTEVDTEAELEALLTDVVDVFTNNDGALTDDDLSNNFLDDLSDVVVTGFAGEYLRYNGANWINASIQEGDLPGNITRDNEWDTIGEIEAATAVNIIISTEIDTIAELETLLGAINVIVSTEIDTIAELEALVGVTFVTSSTVLAGDVTGNITDTVVGNDSHNHTATTISLQLGNLTNVYVPAPNDNDVLTWDAATGNWTAQVYSAATDVDDIPVDGATTSAISSNWAYDLGQTVREPTGFPNTTETSPPTFASPTVTLAKTGATFDFYIKGVKYTKNTNQTVALPNGDATDIGTWYIYFNTAGTLTATKTTSWDIAAADSCSVAVLYFNGAAGRISDERHGTVMDAATHDYLHYTVGTRYVSGLTGTFTDPANISIALGVISDEDLEYSFGIQTKCVPFYHASGVYTFLPAQNSYVVQDGGGLLQYDDLTDLADVDNNKYVAYWIFATLDTLHPIWAMPGQRHDTTLAQARENNKYESLTLGALPYPEMKLLYRVIVQRSGTNEVYVETQDLRSVSNLPAGAYLATDHGALTGLLDDDHTQYILRTDSFAGSVTGTYGATVIGNASTSSLGVAKFDSNYFDATNGEIDLTQEAVPNSLLRDTNFMMIPVNAGWITVSSGTGAAVYQQPFRLCIGSGTAAAGFSYAYAYMFGYNSAGGNFRYIHWDKKLIVHFNISKYVVTDGVAKFQIKDESAAVGYGDLAMKGIGVEVSDADLIWESYGAHRVETDSGVNLAASVVNKITIVFDPSVPNIKFYLDGVLNYTETDANHIPSGDSASNGYLILALAGGAVHPDNYLSMMEPWIWQDYN